MGDKPILFSAPMVRAILDGSKTQTRRILKPEWLRCLDPEDPDDLTKILAQCPYGVPGDRLWVRETWGPCAGGVVFRADGGTACPDGGKWKPSIFMPRWASRITLEVVSVRVERLKDISEKDAEAEGAEAAHWKWDIDAGRVTEKSCYRAGFAALWESIHGPGSWDANPWVWRIEFGRVA